MSFFDRLAGLLSSRKALDGWSTQDRFFSSTSLSYPSSNFKNEKDYVNAFQAVSYVGKCVNKISSQVASLEYQICNDNGEEISSSELESVLIEPTPGMTWYEWIKTISMHLILDGNIFLAPEASDMFNAQNKNSSSLYILNPALVNVYDSEGRSVRAGDLVNSYSVSRYSVTINGKMLYVTPDRIRQWKFANPLNTLRGMGIIQQNALTLDVEKNQANYNNNLYQNGVVSNLHVDIKDGNLGPKVMDEIKQQFNNNYGGSSNWGKAIITSGETKVNQLGLSLSDMDYLEQRKMNKTDIRSMFGVPPIVVGDMDEVKYDTAKEQLDVFYSITLPDYYTPIQEGLTHFLREYYPGVNFRFITPANRDIKTMGSVLKDMFDRGALSGNEYREWMEIPQIEDDEQLNKRYITMQYIPVDESSAEDEQMEEEEPEATDEEPKIDLEKGMKASDWQMAFHRRARSVKKRIEKMIVKDVSANMDAMENAVMMAFDKKDIGDVDLVLDSAALQANAKKSATRMFTSAVVISLNDVNQAMGTSVDPSFKNIQVRQLVVEKLSKQYVERTLNTRIEEVRSIIQGGINEGVGIGEIKGRIQDNFNALRGENGWKAMRIARTEASNAYDQSALLSYQEAGVELVDVVGCEDAFTDCLATRIPIEEAGSLEFHPNHTGTIVPRRVR